jgi:hypothetical protein
VSSGLPAQFGRARLPKDLNVFAKRLVFYLLKSVATP